MAKVNFSGGGRARLAPVNIPQTLINGNKFVKFDDDSSVGVPVTLWVDPKGYFLYWKDQNKEMDCLDMSYIRDTRRGRYAHLPKDLRLRETINMGVKDCPLQDKIITVCYGMDLAYVNFVNFAAISKEIAKEWTDVIFKCATNLLAHNGSVTQCLEKCYTKLTLVRDNEDKIPIRNIIKTFAQNKEDRKRIQHALEMAQLPFGTNDKLNSLTFDQFSSFCHHLCPRHDVNGIFHLIGTRQKPYLTAEQFVKFLNSEQRDSRLNEVLYPYCDVKKTQAIIEQHESNREMAQAGLLSQKGFLLYLMSQDNTIIPTEKLDFCYDLTQPLSHYFINSSHNTYLTGHQLTGKSSAEMYRQVLLTGCRCVELDCWDGRGADEEPVITHGFTMCTEVSFKEVIEAIFESAFKVSDYPVILSFENHCSAKQQAKMALYCRTIFGDALLTDPFDSHKLEPNVSLPSPELLKKKIIIKNKKRNSHSCRSVKTRHEMNVSLGAVTHFPNTPRRSLPQVLPIQNFEGLSDGDAATHPPKIPRKSISRSDTERTENGTEKLDQKEDRQFLFTGDFETDSDSESESEKEESELTEEEVQKLQVVKQEKGTSGHEVEAELELSSLVNYIQPARFHSFDYSEKRNRSYECTSFVETQATTLLKSFPVDFVNFNKRQLSRVYPRGTRVDSSNYMPQIFWNAGCQMVALNFQTLDLPMQLNLGIFEYNGRSGYILKPDFMRRKDRQLDPFAESTVDGIVAGTVKVKIISGQFITDRKLGTYVEVDMFGLPADTVRRKFRTKVCLSNGIDPMYDEEEPFVFPKVIMPNLAILRIAVYQENSTTLLGHRILPVDSLRPGYRYISLRNESNQPLGLATLFAHITVKDFVPDALAGIADALCNPIAYQSSLERHSQQLAVLEMDYDTELNEALGHAGLCSAFEVAWFASEKGSTEPAELKCSSRTSESTKDSISNKSASDCGNSPSSVAETSVFYTDVNQCFSVQNSPPFSVSADSKLQVVLDMKSIEKDITLSPVDIEKFKQSKQHQKLLSRFDREMNSLLQKNEKLRASNINQHQMQLLKVTKDYGEPKSGSAFPTYLGDTLTEEQKRKDLQKQYQEETLRLSQQLHQSEMDLGLTYQMQLSALLHQMVAADRSSRLAQIDKAHNQEIARYKKQHDAQNWEEMKALAKKYKDKNELARIRREAMQKNIKAAVLERKKFQDNLDKLVGKANAMYNEVFAQIEKERTQKEEKLRSSFAEKCASDATKYTMDLFEETSYKEQQMNNIADPGVIKTVNVTEYASTRL